jgi:1-acyl-sn-glycerol-3-phosphate acyltransferase
VCVHAFWFGAVLKNVCATLCLFVGVILLFGVVRDVRIRCVTWVRWLVVVKDYRIHLHGRERLL